MISVPYFSYHKGTAAHFLCHDRESILVGDKIVNYPRYLQKQLRSLSAHFCSIRSAIYVRSFTRMSISDGKYSNIVLHFLIIFTNTSYTTFFQARSLMERLRVTKMLPGFSMIWLSMCPSLMQGELIKPKCEIVWRAFHLHWLFAHVLIWYIQTRNQLRPITVRSTTKNYCKKISILLPLGI